MNSAPPGQVNHFDAVIFQGGDEQALRPGIKGQMVEPAFDTLELNRVDLNEGFPSSRELRRESEANQRQETGLCGRDRSRGRIGYQFRACFAHVCPGLDSIAPIVSRANGNAFGSSL